MNLSLVTVSILNKLIFHSLWLVLATYSMAQESQPSEVKFEKVLMHCTLWYLIFSQGVQTKDNRKDNRKDTHTHRLSSQYVA